MRPTDHRSVCRLVTAALIAAVTSGCTRESPKTDEQAVAANLPPSVLPGLPTIPQAQRDAEDRDAPDVRAESVGDSVRLVVTLARGARINALLPPVLERANTPPVMLRAAKVTPDSAYFVGDVSITLARANFPIRGTLRTSYCRAGEGLCRTATRAVTIDAPAR